MLDALEAERLLSDERYTEAYVHSRESRGFGPLRIRAELRERGVDAALVERYLDQDRERVEARAREEHRKKYGSRSPENHSERARQARFLQGRGFPGDVIWRVVGGSEE